AGVVVRVVDVGMRRAGDDARDLEELAVLERRTRGIDGARAAEVGDLSAPARCATSPAAAPASRAGADLAALPSPAAHTGPPVGRAVGGWRACGDRHHRRDAAPSSRPLDHDAPTYWFSAPAVPLAMSWKVPVPLGSRPHDAGSATSMAHSVESMEFIA